MVDGGPAGGEAVQWTLYFKDGGVGTFIPFFFRSCAYVRSIASRMQQQQQYQQPAGVGYPPPATAAPEAGAAPPQQLLQTALVDPSGEPATAVLARLRSLHAGACSVRMAGPACEAAQPTATTPFSLRRLPLLPSHRPHQGLPHAAPGQQPAARRRTQVPSPAGVAAQATTVWYWSGPDVTKLPTASLH